MAALEIHPAIAAAAAESVSRQPNGTQVIGLWTMVAGSVMIPDI
jgi:hypothetical protein